MTAAHTIERGEKMRKLTLIIITIIVFMLYHIVSNAAERGEQVPQSDQIDWQAQGFIKMNATAYHMGETTRNGSEVHTGGCAASPDHLGDVAIIYTLDGDYLGLYECNDTGGTDGLNNGYVIDIYRTNYTQCQSLMRLTGGKVYVKWIKGEG